MPPTKSTAASPSCSIAAPPNPDPTLHTMPDVFTPLTPAALASGGAPSAVSSAGAFKPLPSPGAAAAATSASAAPGNCAAKPVITLQRKGNVVTSIRVQCSCGQVLDINCQY